MDVGFIGLGKMGRPMVGRLLAAGHAVHVFNRSPGPMAALAAQGALPAPDAAGVARRSEVVLTALPTAESVETVFGQLVEAARHGQIFVDHSTVSPRLNRWCAERLAEKEAHFLDAPVSGGPAGALAGSLTVMVGGDEPVFERARPVFEAFGGNVRRCGPAGAGQVVKLVNQLLVAIHTSAIAEAAVFGACLGADPRIILDLIGTSFGASAMMTRNMPRFMAGDFTPATPVSLIAKDLGVINGEAERAGVPIPFGDLARARFGEAVEHGLGEHDMAAVVRLWEDASGTAVPRAQR